MPRNWSKAVPQGNGPVRHDEVGPNQPTLVDLYRMIEELFDKSDRELDELTEEVRATKHCLTGLGKKLGSHVLSEADVPSDTETRKCTESAAVADQAVDGDSCSAKRVHAVPTSLTSFNMKA